MDMPRTRQVSAWLWRQLHRSDESYWYLAPVVFGWIGLVAGFVGFVCHELTTGWQPLIVLAAFSHQLMWGALIALLVFAVSRRWWALFAAAVIFVGVAATQAGLYVPGAVAAGGDRITLLQANLRVGAANPAHLVRIVEQRHVDIATTEELTTSERNRLVAAGLTQQLPYHFDAPLPTGGGGLAIWSRYPISAEVNYPGFELGVLSVQVALPDQTITVFAVHLLPPWPYPSHIWTHEIAALQHLLASAATRGRRIVVGGDFNATTDTGQFRRLLTNGYGDAAEDLGAGYLPTYPADRWFPPLIAIDHVLTANVQAATLSTVALPGSDHRGLLATLAP